MTQCIECKREIATPYKTSEGSACQACYRKLKRRERGLRKPGRKPVPGTVSHKKMTPEQKAEKKSSGDYKRKMATETHCAQGHEKSEVSGYWQDNEHYAGNRRWMCRLCLRNYQTKFRGRDFIPDDVPVAPRNGDKTHCKLGHSYEETAIYNADGSRQCKKCKVITRKIREYGVTPEIFERMLVEQDLACAICHNGFGETIPHIDHDHSTGEVRGLLCSNCNVGIGFLQDDPEVLRSAIKYLEN